MRINSKLAICELWLKSFCILFSSFLLFQTADCRSTQDRFCHESNQKIFAEVIERYLKSHPQTRDLFRNIDLIGKEALQKGLDLSCYTYLRDPLTGALGYTAVPLLEGNSNTNAIFLLYIWPPETEALKRSPNTSHHKTIIHSHPIPCAYTVLSGSITEYCYTHQNASDKSIFCCGKHHFQLGEKSVDLNETQFIHQLVFENEGVAPAITLHVYGCSTVPSLRQIFEKAAPFHEYAPD